MLHGSHARLAIVPSRVHLVTVRRRSQRGRTGNGSGAPRRQRSRAFREYWGTRWIVLPNPQYGSWEGALYNFNYGLSPLRVLEEKREQLTPKRPE